SLFLFSNGRLDASLRTGRSRRVQIFLIIINFMFFVSSFEFFVSSFENTGRMASVGSSRTPSITSFQYGVAGTQVHMDVSRGILANLDAGRPCRHDKDLYLYVL